MFPLCPALCDWVVVTRCVTTVRAAPPGRPSRSRVSPDSSHRAPAPSHPVTSRALHNYWLNIHANCHRMLKCSPHVFDAVWRRLCAVFCVVERLLMLLLKIIYHDYFQFPFNYIRSPPPSIIGWERGSSAIFLYFQPHQPPTISDYTFIHDQFSGLKSNQFCNSIVKCKHLNLH